MEIIQMNLKFLAFHFVNQKKRDFFLSLKIAVPTKSIIATTDINLNVSAPDNEIDKLINKVKYLIFESFFATLQNLFGIVKQTCVNSLCRKLFFSFLVVVAQHFCVMRITKMLSAFSVLRYANLTQGIRALWIVRLL